MVLSLQEIEFFFDPLDRVHDIELKRASTGASVASRHLKVRKQLTVELELSQQLEKLTGCRAAAAAAAAAAGFNIFPAILKASKKAPATR